MSTPIEVQKNPDGSWTAKGGSSLTVLSVTAVTEHKAVAGHAVALSAIQAQGKGWIKCSDRLPEQLSGNAVEYIVCAVAGGQQYVFSAQYLNGYAWDLETNTYSSQKFTVRHIRDKRGGGQALTEERDIYEITANMGGRRLRARLLAILPPDLVEAAVFQCRKTLAGDTSLPLADRVRALVDAFAQQGVTEKHLRAYLNKSLDEILPEEIASLRGVFNSIKNGQAAVGDFFSIKPAESQTADLNAALTEAQRSEG